MISWMSSRVFSVISSLLSESSRKDAVFLTVMTPYVMRPVGGFILFGACLLCFDANLAASFSC